ncbi:threonine synthase [Bradyrhizobium zhanjiangense]|uniref:Pyridoxal-phosphate dependent enzyme n=1 Tax=Bradyrhizobium zhanjiangense TaxID=1325107 RepID=A0A4Q0Q4I8_9BRAD|nr:pyridoxal-phosphate dependent enzyme [Bradyrhizobium zhanjiangense]RXG83892.1 pyridoxal-phosphate dependent enzyme [Bradyrhizobium zhanjiangense]
MDKALLKCGACGAVYEFKPRFVPCERCGSPLHVSYVVPACRHDFETAWSDENSSGIWRYRSRLPVPDSALSVSLGEGGTPIVRSTILAERLGLPNLVLKNEAANPTWSFKDRLNCVNATLARHYRFRGIAASSTGNHGVSAAAFAAAAGLESLVLFPYGTPDLYIRQVHAYGGRAIVMNWAERGELLMRLVKEAEWYPSKSTLPAPVANPFGVEGYKTIAFEVARQMRHNMPEFVFVPVGSGDDYFGICQGFRELLEAEIIDVMPTIVACEASGSAPLNDAVKIDAKQISQVTNPRTYAVSISEGIVSNLAIQALRFSNGQSCTVSEGEISAAAECLAGTGLLLEASSCVPLAAAKKFVHDTKASPDTRMLAILTATGLRWPTQIPNSGEPPIVIQRSHDKSALISRFGPK